MACIGASTNPTQPFLEGPSGRALRGEFAAAPVSQYRRLAVRPPLLLPFTARYVFELSHRQEPIIASPTRTCQRKSGAQAAQRLRPTVTGIDGSDRGRSTRRVGQGSRPSLLKESRPIVIPSSFHRHSVVIPAKAGIQPHHLPMQVCLILGGPIPSCPSGVSKGGSTPLAGVCPSGKDPETHPRTGGWE